MCVTNLLGQHEDFGKAQVLLRGGVQNLRVVEPRCANALERWKRKKIHNEFYFDAKDSDADRRPPTPC